MKYIWALAVIFILFILPAGSYYYLIKGFELRKSVLSDLVPKGKFPDLEVNTAYQTLSIHELLKQKMTVLYLAESDNDIPTDHFIQLLNQFDKRKGFQLLYVGDSLALHRELLSESFVPLYPLSELPDTLAGDRYYLIDENGQIRNYYEKEDMKKLATDIAFILPLPESKDIKLEHE